MQASLSSQHCSQAERCFPLLHRSFKMLFSAPIMYYQRQLTSISGSTNSNEAINISLVTPGPGGAKAIATFKPALTYALFGEQESIFGYKGLKIYLQYNACDMRPNVSTHYTRKYKQVGETEALDLQPVLKEFLPNGEYHHLLWMTSTNTRYVQSLSKRSRPTRNTSSQRTSTRTGNHLESCFVNSKWVPTNDNLRSGQPWHLRRIPYNSCNVSKSWFHSSSTEVLWLIWEKMAPRDGQYFSSSSVRTTYLRMFSHMYSWDMQLSTASILLETLIGKCRPQKREPRISISLSQNQKNHDSVAAPEYLNSSFFPPFRALALDLFSINLYTLSSWARETS